MAKFTIAVYQLPGELNTTPDVFHTSDYRCSGYAKISQEIEVDIPMLPKQQQLEAHLTLVNAEERQLIAEHLTRLQEIADRRKRLLAITHQPAGYPL